ncbi:hypothetical protein ABZ617_11055 [Nocardiopsis alba]|uniref:hypothetical protein n=1 Tax=Nocardiopsis alba TaxID=53437 RepID=UPI0033F31DCB
MNGRYENTSRSTEHDVRRRGRIRRAILREFTPPPMPRPAPSEEQLAEGHLAVGMIDEAIEDTPGSDVQGPDTLVISAEAPGGGRLQRTAACPLPISGNGRRLVGQAIGFRHTTFEPDHVNDILVVRWPREVGKALEPAAQNEGPGTLRAHMWGFLAGCGFALLWAGIALTPILLCGIVFGGDMFTDLPAWFRPGAGLAASVAAVPLGLFLVAACTVRKNAALAHRSREAGD